MDLLALSCLHFPWTPKRSKQKIYEWLPLTKSFFFFFTKWNLFPSDNLRTCKMFCCVVSIFTVGCPDIAGLLLINLMGTLRQSHLASLLRVAGSKIIPTAQIRTQGLCFKKGCGFLHDHCWACSWQVVPKIYLHFTYYIFCPPAISAAWLGSGRPRIWETQNWIPTLLRKLLGWPQASHTFLTCHTSQNFERRGCCKLLWVALGWKQRHKWSK